MQAGRFDVAGCVGPVTFGRRRSGAACPRGGRRRHEGASLPQARARAAPPCSAPGADWGGQAPPPYAGAGRAAGATLLCHRRVGVGGRPGPRRPAPSLPPSFHPASCSVAMPPLPAALRLARARAATVGS